MILLRTVLQIRVKKVGSGESISDRCLDAMGCLEVGSDIMDILRSISDNLDNDDPATARQIIRLIASSPEFQKC